MHEQQAHSTCASLTSLERYEAALTCFFPSKDTAGSWDHAARVALVTPAEMSPRPYMSASTFCPSLDTKEGTEKEQTRTDRMSTDEQEGNTHKRRDTDRFGRDEFGRDGFDRMVGWQDSARVTPESPLGNQ